MKMSIIAGSLLLAASSPTAAEVYKSLEINKTDDSAVIIAAKDLTVAIDDGEVIFYNPAGEITRMHAAEITRMQFSEGESSIAGIAISTDAPTAVYTLGGTPAGSFYSLDEAVDTLPSGTYIIDCGNGNAVKIHIGK